MSKRKDYGVRAARTWIPFELSASFCGVLPLAWLVSGCAVDLASGGADASGSAGMGFLSEDAQSLWAKPSRYWCALGTDGKGCVNGGNPTSAGPAVSVCWEKSTFTNTAFADQRRWNEEAFRRNWARYGQVSFVNPSGASTWGQCTSGQAGIHFYIDLAAENAGTCGGSNTGVGKDMNGLPNGQRLPSCNPNVCGRSSSAPVEPCVKHIAIHELGHDLGFFHENEKPDTSPASCRQSTAPTGQAYGEYDCNINYGAPIGNTCSAMFSTRDGCPEPVGESQLDISPGNIASIQRAYGRRLHALVDTNGRCLHTNSGGAAFAYDCEDPSHHDVRYQASTRLLRASFAAFPGTNYFPVGTSVSTVGQAVRLTDGSGLGSKWSFNNVYIRGWGGLCLDLDGGNTSGGSVQLWYCGANGGANQRWTITPAKEIRFGNTSKCLMTPSSGTGQLFVTSCSGSVRQQFKFDSDSADNASHIVSLHQGKCLDAAGPLDSEYLNGIGIPTNGTPINVFGCINAQFNQKFMFTGSIVNDYGLCLDRNTGNNGTAFTQETCDGHSSQTFDLNF